ncbi:MAG: Enoyl-CoA hydratase, partial [uncultured Actinomycetospora sp.]
DGVRAARGGRRGGHDPPGPAPHECGEPAAQPRAGRDLGRGRGTHRRPGGRRLRRREGAGRGRRRQGDGRPHLLRDGRARPRAVARVRGGLDDPQAGGRRDHRLRARRRVRAGAVVRPPHRRRQRQGRPARDPARDHPGRRRHPAARAPDRAGEGQGRDLHRPHVQGRGGAGPRDGRRGRRPRRRLHPGARLGVAVRQRPDPGHRRRQDRHRPRARHRPAHRPEPRERDVRGPVRHRGPDDRHALVRRERARQGPVPGAL